LFNQLAAEHRAPFSGLRGVIFGGEAAQPETLRQLLAMGPDEILVNGYGPTENGTFSTFYTVRELAAEATSVPIGRPIDSSSLLVVDRRLEPLPIGVAGEILVAGDGLARGYHRRPGLTAERFVPVPPGAPGSWSPGARAYRTGDLGRWNADGQIEFLGRRDFQVKIRGHRIEPGEVQAVLGRAPGVEECVVTVRRDGGPHARLAAYAVTRQADVAAPGEIEEQLKRFLKDRLPAYMVPSAVMVLPSLPKNPNGKVDLGALPAPVQATAPSVRHRPPATALERLVAGAWVDVLPVKAVGLEDNFFDLGGHSLLATKVFSRLRAQLDAEIPNATLFEAQDLGAFVELVREALAAKPAGQELLAFLAQLDDLSEEELDRMLGGG
ncbi:MAG: non-ribosomal peptide synthetase, partial [Acidobacteria bacterium]|nr:non-ribosomal peptide synthetase [Acidobacteriota bacterium]